MTTTPEEPIEQPEVAPAGDPAPAQPGEDPGRSDEDPGGEPGGPST